LLDNIKDDPEKMVFWKEKSIEQYLVEKYSTVIGDNVMADSSPEPVMELTGDDAINDAFSKGSSRHEKAERIVDLFEGRKITEDQLVQHYKGRYQMINNISINLIDELKLRNAIRAVASGPNHDMKRNYLIGWLEESY
jgi:hypothetical protein